MKTIALPTEIGPHGLNDNEADACGYFPRYSTDAAPWETDHDFLLQNHRPDLVRTPNPDRALSALDLP